MIKQFSDIPKHTIVPAACAGYLTRGIARPARRRLLAMTDAGAAARLAGCSGNGGNGNGNGNDGGQRIEDPIQLLPVHAFTDYNNED